MDDKTFVSIIIPTYQRGEILCSTLGEILKQNYLPFEVILVDQTPRQTLYVQQSLTELRRRYPALSYIQLPQPGLPYARNEGIRRARGSILLFCDDDIVPSDQWIAGHIRNYVDPQVGGVVGQIIEPGRDPMGDRLGQLLGKVGYITFWGRPVGNFGASYCTVVQTVRGCNMSFRAEAIHEAGLFDEGYIGNAQFEETDLSFRVRSLGYQIVFDPLPSIRHLYLPTGGCRSTDRISWYNDYLHNKALFFKKNMPYHTHIPFFMAHILIAIREGVIRAHSVSKTLDLLRAMLWGYRME